MSPPGKRVFAIERDKISQTDQIPITISRLIYRYLIFDGGSPFFVRSAALGIYDW